MTAALHVLDDLGWVRELDDEFHGRATGLRAGERWTVIAVVRRVRSLGRLAGRVASPVRLLVVGRDPSGEVGR